MDTGARIRYPYIDEALLSTFRETNASNAFCCRFHHCARNFDGFADEDARREHENCHVPRIMCTETSCTYASQLGFKTAAELQRHVKTYHHHRDKSSLSLITFGKRLSADMSRRRKDHLGFQPDAAPRVTGAEVSTNIHHTTSKPNSSVATNNPGLSEWQLQLRSLPETSTVTSESSVLDDIRNQWHERPSSRAQPHTTPVNAALNPDSTSTMQSHSPTPPHLFPHANSFTSRRPNASALPTFELPPPPLANLQTKLHTPAYPLHSTELVPTMLTSVDNLLAPPGNSSLDGLSPGSGATPASSLPSIPGGHYTPNSTLWSKPQSSNYGFQRGGHIFSPSLNTIVRRDNSPTASEFLPPSPYELPQYGAPEYEQHK